MNRLIKLLVLISVAGLPLATDLFAQKAPAKPVVKTTPKFNPRFGPFTNGTIALIDDIKRLANAELIVKDSTGQQWNVIAFRFGWRRRDVSDDTRTGKRKVVFLFNAVEVNNNTRLPQAWQKEIVEGVQTSEEFLFEAILVQHPVTKITMQAPSISFKIK